MALLVAPTEPTRLKAMGVSNLAPERYGVDFMWTSHERLCGVQRKEIKDLIASVADGRLAKELQQMKPLGFAALCVEGEPTWTSDGEMVKDYGQRWTRASYSNLLLSVQQAGCYVLHSSNVADTERVVNASISWTEKPAHRSLVQRPGPIASWGSTPNDRDFGLHILQGLPGIGVELAGRIWDHFKGLPFVLSVSDAELMQVDGLGKGKVANLRRVFG